MLISIRGEIAEVRENQNLGARINQNVSYNFMVVGVNVLQQL
jgi:hypothetical protein